ncbi:4540_t:CDS:2 [Funneliformis geosporum]|uniref:4540_t:CDS:1 n=1 Tax=Funneliformis geosporum TaxID=1117311 RepID=A0A9W4SN94_9GLOM|nr:4540_t:CDS:2 [Funneliformis geosporum]
MTLEDDYVVKADIDTSESINVAKLNEALKAVFIMQQLMFGGHLHESRKIHINVLNRPEDFINTPNEEFPPNSSLF